MEDVVLWLWRQVLKVFVCCVFGDIEGSYDPIFSVFKHSDEPILRGRFEEGFDAEAEILWCGGFGHCA